MFKIDTYRDGGTVRVFTETDDREFFINNMIGSKDIGTVHACYPTEGVPISTKAELLTANRVLTESLSHFTSPNEIVMIGLGLGWIQTQLYKLEDKEK